MAIEYILLENHLSNNPSKYYARMQNLKHIDQKGLIKHMSTYGSLTESQATAFLSEYHFQLLELLKSGCIVNDGLIRYCPSITGKFDDEEDYFDPNRHQIRVNISSTVLFKKAMQLFKLRRVDKRSHQALIKSFTDVIHKKKNQIFSPGNIAVINGRRLSFDTEDKDQGLFFVNKNSTAYKAEKIGVVEPSRIVFIIPDEIPKGSYSLEIRSRKDSDGYIRTSYFSNTLSCQN